jgi:LPXTG-motif cell wall-anchored protein
MVVRRCVLVMLMALAQPAVATQMVNLPPPERAAALASCSNEAPGCATGGSAGDQAGNNGESGNSGPIIAGLLGLLVLGAVFGRRKSGLPEVVS